MIFDAISGLVKGIGDTAIGIINQLTLSPEEKVKAQIAMQQMAMDFQKKIWELETSDRDSARKREIETKDPTVRQLAFLYTFGYFGIVISCWYYGIPDSAHDMLVMLLGVLTAAQAAIIGYYFGSSHGSEGKTKILDRIVNHAKPE